MVAERLVSRTAQCRDRGHRWSLGHLEEAGTVWACPAGATVETAPPESGKEGEKYFGFFFILPSCLSQ